MTNFADLHRAGDPLVLPNAWDYGSGAVLAAAGFPALGTTSLGVAAVAGLPDGHGATRDRTRELAALLAPLPALLTVDIENGYSDDPDEVADYVADLYGLGAVGINLEDGRPDGTLAPLDRQCRTIAAIRQRLPGIFVNARTDTHWLAPSDPPPLSVALERCAAFLAAGADGVFVPALADPADIRELTRQIDAPVNILFQPGKFTLPQLADLGVRRISCGSLLYRAALGAALATVRQLAAGDAVSVEAPSYAEVSGLLDEASSRRSSSMPS
jgi:2-methylisocitrate lyase-like PEP mutase family enzyme